MPRLDADRMDAWLGIEAAVLAIGRQIDADLREEWAVPLGWFEVLRAIRDLGGRARPNEIASRMNLPPSSLSRRLDRLDEEGWIARHPDIDVSDRRAVDVELTESGRKLWREMNVSYRRAVQRYFASRLDDAHIGALRSVSNDLSLTSEQHLPQR